MLTDIIRSIAYHAFVCQVGVTKTKVIFFLSFDKTSWVKLSGGNPYGNNLTQDYCIALMAQLVGSGIKAM